jgi:hypothetical protein
MNLKTLLSEYDENLKIVNELRNLIRIRQTPERLQELGAHLIWRASLRLQILQLYFRNL